MKASIFIGYHLVVLHPSRDPFSRLKWFNNPRAVMLVDGLNFEDLNQEVVDFISTVDDCKISVHLEKGSKLYESHVFLFSHGNQVVLKDAVSFLLGTV
jgi:hypothetical protein